MPFADRRTVVFLLLITLLVVVRVRSEAPDDRIEVLSGPIREVLDLQVDCWNRGDLDAFAATYWNSPELVFLSGSERHVGWQAMRERYRNRYEGEGREMGRLRFDGLEVRPLGPEAGYASGRWRLEMPDGSTPSGMFTVIVRKLPDGWRIVHDHTSSDAP